MGGTLKKMIIEVDVDGRLQTIAITMRDDDAYDWSVYTQGIEGRQKARVHETMIKDCIRVLLNQLL